MPLLHPVTQVRQRQRAVVQGRSGDAARMPAQRGGRASAARNGLTKEEKRRPPPGGRAGVAVRSGPGGAEPVPSPMKAYAGSAKVTSRSCSSNLELVAF